MKKTLKKLMMLTASAMILTAVAPTVFAQNDSNDNAEDPATEQSADDGTDATDADTTDDQAEESELQTALHEAVEMFRAEYPDVEMEQIDIELRREDTYEIEINGFDDENEYDIKFRTDPVEIVETDIERDDDREEALDFEAYITIDEATEIALEEAGFGIVTNWQLDHDDRDGFHWDLDVEDRESDREAEIEIDALTGEIIDVEYDD